MVQRAFSGGMQFRISAQESSDFAACLQGLGVFMCVCVCDTLCACA